MTKRIYRPIAFFALSLLAAGAAQAQGSVTLYGVVDAAVRYGSGLDANNSGSAKSSSAISSGIDNTSRFGMRGVEDLGGGLKAVFNLESGVNLDTGAQANATKLFDRAATVGLQGEWGTLTVGRQTTVLADTVGAVDPMGVRFAGFNPNVAISALNAHRLGIEFGPAGSTTGAYRLDNSIKYVGRFSNFTVRAMHAFGEQSSSSALSSSGVGAAYQTADWNAALSYAQYKNVAGLTLTGYLGGVGAKLGTTKLALSYGSHTAETSVTAKTRNRTLGLGGTIPLTGEIDLVLAAYQVKRTRTAAVDDGFNRFVSFLEYKLSKRTKLYGELDQTRWKNDYQGAGFKDTASGLSLGILHTF